MNAADEYWAAPLQRARPGEQGGSPDAAGLLRRLASRSPRQGFVMHVPRTPCAIVEDQVGCVVHVTAGESWITAEGRLLDVIATPGMAVPLGRGGRFNVSALNDAATVLIAPAGDARDVRFILRERDGSAHVRIVRRVWSAYAVRMRFARTLVQLRAEARAVGLALGIFSW
jgi:hypothetical protein